MKRYYIKTAMKIVGQAPQEENGLQDEGKARNRFVDFIGRLGVRDRLNKKSGIRRQIESLISDRHDDLPDGLRGKINSKNSSHFSSHIYLPPTINGNGSSIKNRITNSNKPDCWHVDDFIASINKLDHGSIIRFPNDFATISGILDEDLKKISDIIAFKKVRIITQGNLTIKDIGRSLPYPISLNLSQFVTDYVSLDNVAGVENVTLPSQSLLSFGPLLRGVAVAFHKIPTASFANCPDLTSIQIWKNGDIKRITEESGITIENCPKIHIGINGN